MDSNEREEGVRDVEEQESVPHDASAPSDPLLTPEEQEVTQEETVQPQNEDSAQEICESTENAGISETDDTAPELQPEPRAGEEASLPPKSQTIYRWDYETQRLTDEAVNKQKRRSGIVTYAVVMTAFFALSFVLLVLSLLTGGLTGKQQPGSSQGNATTGGDRVVYIREDNGESGYLTLQEIYAKSVDSVVAVSVKKRNGSGVGTGFVLSANGHIATNYHVVEDATEITVQTFDGTEYAAELINSSETDDLAVLKIEATDLPVLPVGSSETVLVGDAVVIIGHPAGLEFGWSTTEGIVSAINREVKIKDTDGTLIKKMTLLQTNANVNSGNSGGPMLNEKGEVIGIITMKLSDGYEGMGFAIPIDGAMEILKAIVNNGSADGVDSSVSKSRAVLGVVGFDVTEGNYYLMRGNSVSMIPEAKIDAVEGEFCAGKSGFYVSEIREGSDAYEKLAAGDIIFAINGHATDTRDKMMAILDEKNVGDEVAIEYWRDGEIFAVKVKLVADQ